MPITLRTIAQSTLQGPTGPSGPSGGLGPTGPQGGAKTTFRYVGVVDIFTGTKREYITSSAALTKINAFVTVAPVGASIGINIRKNGTVATTITIASGQTSAQTTPSVSFAAGDYITVDVTSMGTTVRGEDLVVVLTFT